MAVLEFNNTWNFWKEGEKEKHGVTLPHDAMISEKRAPDCDSAHNSGFFPGGKYYYEKQWAVPHEYAGKRVWLRFDGVYRNAQVLLNGTQVAARPCGYSPFMADCSAALRPGETNTLLVVADNSQTPNARWYTGSGIYRPVQLVVKNQSHILPGGVRVKTLAIRPARIAVEVAHTGSGEVRVEILQNGQVVATGVGATQELEIPEAQLWGEDTPVLYTCRATLLCGEEEADEETTTFGIRTLAWGTNGLLVNGQAVKLRGACVHHDNGVLGAAAFADAEERKIRLLKQAGFNAVRSSHNMCSTALLHAADKYGVYVMDELGDVWYKHKQAADYAADFDEWHLEDLRAMVERGYNHPAVIMYSIGNEIGEVYEERGIELTREMADFCRTLDATRPVTCGTNLMLCMMASKGIGAFSPTDTKKEKKPGRAKKKKGKMVGSELYNMVINVMGSRMDNTSKKPVCDALTAAHFAALDIAGYNYGSIRYENEPNLHPGRIIVGSETRPPNIVENWRLTEKLPHVIGDFQWTGWDYIGEAGIGAIAYSSRSDGGLLLKKYPYIFAGCGVIDICGHERPETHLNRAAWHMAGGKPLIGVEPLPFARDKRVASMWRKSNAVRSWAWQGCEGEKAEVVVYAEAGEVELLLNGETLGRKPVKDCRAFFKTKYQPGTLEAVLYDAKGRETGRDVLQSAAGQPCLVLVPETQSLAAGGQALCYIDVRIEGENGVLECAADTQIQLEVSGAGTLQGFGSANPYTEDSFTTGVCHSFFGRAQAVVRAGTRPGGIRVTATAKDMAVAALDIPVV